MPLDLLRKNHLPQNAKKNPDPSWSQRLSTGLIGLLAIGLTGYRTPCAAAVTQGLALCTDTLLPALFPFFVLSGLVVETGLAQRAGALFSRPMNQYFRLPGCSASLFLLGALGGYPTGARAVVQLYQQKACTKEEAQRMLALCNNCGPGFFLGVAGGVVLGSAWAGLVLWLIHLAAALLAALLCRSGKDAAAPLLPAQQPLPLPQALVRAVTGAVQSTLGVCGFVLFFSVLLCLLRETGILSLFSRIICLFGCDTAFGDAFAAGLLEISCGVTALTHSAAGLPLKGAAAAFLLSFGGCSVLFQTMQQTEATDLSLSLACKQKLLQAAIAALLSFLYLCYFFDSAAAFLPQAPASPLIYTGITSVSYLLFCLVALVKNKKSRYNTSRNR